MAHLIRDHPFESDNGTYWGMCKTCNLAPSAHATSLTSLQIDATKYRCPDCVDQEVDPCSHCACGNGEAEDDRGAVLRCPVHGPGAAYFRRKIKEERPEPLPVAEIDLSEMQEHVIGDNNEQPSS